MFLHRIISCRRCAQKNAINEYNKYQSYFNDCLKEDEKALDVTQNLCRGGARSSENSKQVWDKWLAWASLLVNVTLVAAKVIAAYLSNSMSILSTLVDSIMDITSGAVIYICVRLIQKANLYEYPIGSNRLEPLAVLVVSVIMIMANIVVIGEAILSTIQQTINPVVDVPTIAIMGAGTGLKVVLLFFCRRRDSPNCRILAMDQRNDIITNIFALLGAYIGHRWWLYADPLGAFVVCSFVAVSWINVARKQFPLLAGRSAKPEFVNRILRIAINHDERIKFIDTALLTYLGANFLVELHIVMDSNMTLQEAHDISEQFQLKLERLPYVQRAFVHCDYNFDDREHL